MLCVMYEIPFLTDRCARGRFYVVYEGSGTQFKMARLSEDTEYRLRICAANEAGEGPYSNVVSTRTTRQPPPSVRGELAFNAHCVPALILFSVFKACLVLIVRYLHVHHRTETLGCLVTLRCPV